MARPEKVRLGDMLVQQELITAEQLEAGLQEQKRTGLKLGRVLMDSGYVTERKIAEALARQLALPFLDLSNFNAKAELVQKLPEAQARRFRAVVLEDKGNSYLVGMADPSDLFAYDEISRVLRREIELAAVQESAILPIIDRMYRKRSFEFISISADKPARKDNALKFLKKEEASNKNYIFNKDNVYELIEALDPKWQGALPYTMLIEPGGKVIYRSQGLVDPTELKKTIVENKYMGRFYNR